MKQWIVPLAMVLSLSACGGGTSTSETVSPTQPEKMDSGEQKDASNSAKPGKYDGFVKANADNLASYAMKFAKSDDLRKEIEKLLNAEPKKAKDKNSDDIAFLQQNDLKEIYAARQFAPVFVNNGQLSPALDPLVAELRQLKLHGLGAIDVQPWVDALNALDEAGTVKAADKFEFTDEEAVVLAKELEAQNVDITDAQAVKKFMAAVVADEKILPRLHETVVTRAKAMSQSAIQAARVEVLTADLAMRFARSMAFENMTHLNEDETASLGKKPTDAKYRQVAANRTKTWFRTLCDVMDAPAIGAKDNGAAKDTEEAAAEAAADAGDELNADSAGSMNEADEARDAQAAELAAAHARDARLHNAQSVNELVQALYPPHPAYKQLMEARNRYGSIEPWSDVPTMTLKAGKSNKNIPALKRRLATEGYYHGNVSEESLKQAGSDVYDDELRAAVRLYHEAHQLQYDEDKGIMKSFWESINTPLSKRIEQIDENLRRWHKTQIIESPYYIFVNVPDFHGEVWRDGERVYRFPVVAGNAKRGCDPVTKQWKFINATPLMHARMLYIEYNPYWIVPPRIEQEDYIKKINEDPNWLKDHGFEYYTDKGHTVLRQLPAENNALGRVKFIFPNPHSTFLHDSPQKGLFKYPIRAFSHGCMRVWEPLELAKRLLQYDGQWKNSIPKDIEDLQTRRIMLKNRFDVFIDYFTVRVGDDGLVYFLADPYKYVRYALEPPKAKELSCKPQPREWIARKSDVGADPE